MLKRVSKESIEYQNAYRGIGEWRVHHVNKKYAWLIN